MAVATQPTAAFVLPVPGQRLLKGAVWSQVVAMSGLCSVMLPRFRGAILFINLISTALAGFFGLFGVFSCLCVVFIYILGIKSFGTDYTLSLKRPGFQSFKDVLFRASWKKMIKRPEITENITRQKK